ncbi:MAG TPA: hypothetical protein VEQ65_08560 [Opitutus sp.]|nr:hypothetical protein [Opitutus sp.]
MRKALSGWWGRRCLARALPHFDLRPPADLPASPQLPLHLLIGARYLPEACLVTHSLTWAAGVAVVPHFYDDGTLTDADCALLRSKLPLARFTRIQEIDSRLAAELPEDRFPCLRRLRPAYPHIRKLTDIHLFPGDWKLVSDADVLFFARPAQLMAALQAPYACHMVDIAPAYGFPLPALEALAGTPMHPQVNVGLYHMPSSRIDWEFVEHCAATLLGTYGFSYYLEQALTAILLARFGARPLDERYVVYPDRKTAMSQQAAALHYVDASRDYYYEFGWRQTVARGRA